MICFVVSITRFVTAIACYVILVKWFVRAITSFWMVMFCCILTYLSFVIKISHFWYDYNIHFGGHLRTLLQPLHALLWLLHVLIWRLHILIWPLRILQWKLKCRCSRYIPINNYDIASEYFVMAITLSCYGHYMVLQYKCKAFCCPFTASTW